MSNPSIVGPGGSTNTHEDRGPALLGTIVVFTTIAAISVGMRLTVRLWLLRAPGWDDAAIVLATALAIASSTAFGLAISHGWGRHIRTLSSHNISASIKYNLIASTLFYLSVIFSKISVGLLFLRILGRAATLRKRYFLYTMMALAFVIGIIHAGYTVGQCQPVAKDWRHEIDGKCHGDVSLHIGIAHAAVNTIVDFGLALFPLTFLVHSSLERAKKLVVVALMSCGVVAGFCSIGRIVPSYIMNNSGDFTYVITLNTWMAITEETVSIFVACVPTFMPLVKLARGMPVETARTASARRGKSQTWPVRSSSQIRKPSDPYARYDLCGSTVFETKVDRASTVEGTEERDIELAPPQIQTVTRIDVRSVLADPASHVGK